MNCTDSLAADQPPPLRSNAMNSNSYVFMLVSLIATFLWIVDMSTGRAYIYRGIYIDKEEYPLPANIITWIKAIVAVGAVGFWFAYKK